MENDRNKHPRLGGDHVKLHSLNILKGHCSCPVDQFMDPHCAPGGLPMIGKIEGIGSVNDSVVCSNNHAVRRIKHFRILVESHVSFPVVFIRPAGIRGCKTLVLSQRNLSPHAIADVALNVCIDKILGRSGKMAQPCKEFVPRRCSVNIIEGLRFCRYFSRGPSHGKQIGGQFGGRFDSVHNRAAVGPV